MSWNAQGLNNLKALTGMLRKAKTLEVDIIFVQEQKWPERSKKAKAALGVAKRAGYDMHCAHDGQGASKGGTAVLVRRHSAEVEIRGPSVKALGGGYVPYRSPSGSTTRGS